LNVEVIKDTGNYSDKDSETDPEIEGMQCCQHVITKEEAVHDIGLQVYKRKNEQQIKHERENIDGGQTGQAAEDKKIEENAIGGKSDKGLYEFRFLGRRKRRQTQPDHTAQYSCQPENEKTDVP